MGAPQYLDNSPIATYSGAAVGLAALAAGSVLVITGSATRVVRIARLSVTGVATAGTAIDLTLAFYSAAQTGGTPTTITLVPHDSKFGAATSLVQSYSAAPTGGTLVGNVRAVKTDLAITGGPEQLVEWTFGPRPSSPLILRGVAQQYALITSATVAGSSIDVDIELTEDAS